MSWVKFQKITLFHFLKHKIKQKQLIFKKIPNFAQKNMQQQLFFFFLEVVTWLVTLLIPMGS